MIVAYPSVAPDPRVGAISSPPWGSGRGRSGSQATREKSCLRRAPWVGGSGIRAKCSPFDNNAIPAPGLTRGPAANCCPTPEAPGQARGAGCL
ncbi:hypothetical protein ROE7235_02934 [Roseibaca ekhonensis]|uniref:Uncharacterized protein n=1 Tax=Roseinatronobacter ekhonensis TaxID=254356 RepID=A0A3B0MZE7_9RHOB|nr:hypothetical protein ROE7235_02934 [Roseibaca ekhonensis]